MVGPVYRCRMLGLSGLSRDVFAALDGGAGVGHEGIYYGCDLFMCCNVDLCMYKDVLED